MKNLNTLNELESEKFLNSIFKNEITVFEDIQGSKIWVNWDGNIFTLKSKSINSEAINLVDLAMQNYYNPAINYFNSLDVRVKSLLNRKWWFCFEYFPDNQPANIEYDRVPKNNLILTTIFKNGKYDMLWGRDENMLPALSIGAKGAVVSTFNYIAPLYHNLIEAFNNGDLKTAALYQQQSIDLIRLLGKYGGIATGKAYMKLIGLDCGEFRLPVKNMSALNFEAFKKDVEGLNFDAVKSVSPYKKSA